MQEGVHVHHVEKYEVHNEGTLLLDNFEYITNTNNEILIKR